MLDILSTTDAIFPTLAEDEAIPALDAFVERRDRPGRDPIFAVETLIEGRSAYAAVFEDATPFLRR